MKVHTASGVALSKCDSRGDAEEEAALVAPYFGFTVIRRAEATLPLLPFFTLASDDHSPFCRIVLHGICQAHRPD